VRRPLAAAVLAVALAACTHRPTPPPRTAPRPESRPERRPEPRPEAPDTPATTPPEPPAAPPPVEARPAPQTQVGLASFYSRKLQGRRTANGERYDGRALTAAHRTARFGTRLRVTELAGGRSVVVRVNDRGPFVRGRVVDLSLAAARALGMVHRGVAQVRVEFLE
jgi:rare lipoprotein A